MVASRLADKYCLFCLVCSLVIVAPPLQGWSAPVVVSQVAQVNSHMQVCLLQVSSVLVVCPVCGYCFSVLLSAANSISMVASGLAGSYHLFCVVSSLVITAPPQV